MKETRVTNIHESSGDKQMTTKMYNNSQTKLPVCPIVNFCTAYIGDTFCLTVHHTDWQLPIDSQHIVWKRENADSQFKCDAKCSFKKQPFSKCTHSSGKQKETVESQKSQMELVHTFTNCEYVRARSFLKEKSSQL